VPPDVRKEGPKQDPWILRRPPGKTEHRAYRDDTLDPPALICLVGRATLSYHLRRLVQHLRPGLFRLRTGPFSCRATILFMRPPDTNPNGRCLGDSSILGAGGDSVSGHRRPSWGERSAASMNAERARL
jgi:hypothetical protein